MKDKNHGEEITFIQSLHKKLCDWLIANPDKNQDDWIRWKENGGDIQHYFLCWFPCDCALKIKRKFPNEDRELCAYCPYGDFESKYDVCNESCLNGLFEKWHQAHKEYQKTEEPKHKEDVKKYMEQIKELPIRTDINIKTI